MKPNYVGSPSIQWTSNSCHWRQDFSERKPICHNVRPRSRDGYMDKRSNDKLPRINQTNKPKIFSSCPVEKLELQTGAAGDRVKKIGPSKKNRRYSTDGGNAVRKEEQQDESKSGGQAGVENKVKPVYVIQCGTELELQVTKYIQDLVKSCQDPVNKLDIELTTYRECQERHKARILLMDLEKCKQKNANMIVLVSKTLFDVVWSTGHKLSFLRIISFMKNSLHIWLDVNERDVKRYSTLMIRKDLKFGRIHVDELAMDSGRDCDARVSLIRSLIQKASPWTAKLNNYACDEEARDMEQRYL